MVLPDTFLSLGSWVCCSSAWAWTVLTSLQLLSLFWFRRSHSRRFGAAALIQGVSARAFSEVTHRLDDEKLPASLSLPQLLPQSVG